MSRNLNAFGLALVAAMALGAIGAQGASAVVAHSFRSDVEDTVLTAAAEGKEKLTLTAGVFVECSDVTFEGTNVGTLRDTLTVHPTYASCNLSGGAESNVTVHTGGCNFELDSDTTTNTHPSGDHASVSLACTSSHSASPHKIEITAPGCNIAFETTHAGNVLVNHSLHGLRYTNLSNHSGKNAGTVTATVRTISYTVTSGSFCGLIGHGAGTYSNASYDGKSTVTGYQAGTGTGSATNGFTWHHGAQINITVSSPE